MSRYRNLFKPGAAPWKETYRRRCVARLKSSRAKLLERYRHMGNNSGCNLQETFLVREVMEEEWIALKALDTHLPSLWKKGSLSEVLNTLENISELAELEEIEQELLSEEQAIIEEYEASLRFDDACLNAIIEGLNDTDKLVCPLCNKNYLSVSSDVITCSCGMCINTQGMTVQQFRALLEYNVTEHSSVCECCPVFSVVYGTETEAMLLMSCQACDYLSVIL
ncbi:RPA-interacting protein isoform X1 [Hypanus sabinus]|uniref:RPA-interacting protein isoform X1 n=1 Tax=Hypanus sabinus TaxID=79690 RepID=UPI0028C3F545|nr:RPA-interacting protein isoform X1 [Hypanus sabinus]